MARGLGRVSAMGRRLGYAWPQRTTTVIKRKIKRLERKTANEVKAVNTVIDNNSPTDGASNIIHISPVAQGVTSLTRVGNWITAKKLLVNMLVYYTNEIVVTALPVPQVFARMVIFIDKSYTNALPTVANVIGTDTVENIAPNFEQADRIKILYDKIKPLSAGGGTGPNTVFRYKKRWRSGHKIHYNGAAATDYDSGNVYVLLMTDATVADVDFYGYCELQFTDS